eukprot:COSAG05_NODE_710_length_7822_cov_18.425353_9_plen_46_part_00
MDDKEIGNHAKARHLLACTYVYRMVLLAIHIFEYVHSTIHSIRIL